MNRPNSLSVRQQPRAVTFDVDTGSLSRLRAALTGWRIDVLYGATVASLPCDWKPDAVDLHVLGVRANIRETLELCRFLTYCAPERTRLGHRTAWADGDHPGSGDPPQRRGPRLLVLVPPGQAAVVARMLEAGAGRCLTLPVEAGLLADLPAWVCERESAAEARSRNEPVHDEDRRPEILGRGEDVPHGFAPWPCGGAPRRERAQGD